MRVCAACSPASAPACQDMAHAAWHSHLNKLACMMFSLPCVHCRICLTVLTAPCAAACASEHRVNAHPLHPHAGGRHDAGPVLPQHLWRGGCAAVFRGAQGAVRGARLLTRVHRSSHRDHSGGDITSHHTTSRAQVLGSCRRCAWQAGADGRHGWALPPPVYVCRDRAHTIGNMSVV